MKKNVIVLEDSSKAKFGGGQKISLYVMEELSRTHSIILADTYKPGEITLFQKKAIPLIKERIDLIGSGQIGSKTSASYNLAPAEILLFPLYLIINIFRLRKSLRELSHKDTICYATTKKALVYAFFLKILFGYKYIFHMHSAESRNKIVQSIMRILYKSANSVISVSGFVDKQLNIKTSRIIYNPVAITTNGVFRTIKDKTTIVAATFSTLLKYKGIDIFMESYRYLSRNGKQIRFEIYGDGPEKAGLQKYEHPNVKLCGFVENVEKFMKGIDLLIIPSVAEETFGMTAIEAMAQGIPVIVTNIGGQSEIVPDGIAGIHVKPGNAKDLAKAIDKIRYDEELYSKLSEGASRTASNYSFQNFNAGINQIFSTY